MNREAEARWARTVLGESTDAPHRSDLAQPFRARRESGESWDRVWSALELPPGPVAPQGFSRRIERAWEAERRSATAPVLSGAWMRAAAAAALLLGVLLGGSLSLSAESNTAEDDSWLPATLSEEYLAALSSPEAADPAVLPERAEP